MAQDTWLNVSFRDESYLRPPVLFLMGATKRRGSSKSSSHDLSTAYQDDWDDTASKQVGQFHPHVVSLLVVCCLIYSLSKLILRRSDNPSAAPHEADGLHAVFNPPYEPGIGYSIDKETVALLTVLSMTADSMASRIRSQLQSNPLQIGERLRLCDALEKHGQLSRPQSDRFEELAMCYRRLMDAFSFAGTLDRADSRRQILVSMKPTVARAAGDRMLLFSENKPDRLAAAVSFLRAGVLESVECRPAWECIQSSAGLLLALHLQGTPLKDREGTLEELRQLPGLELDWPSPLAIHQQLPGIRHRGFWDVSEVPWLAEVAREWQGIRTELDRYIDKLRARTAKDAWEHQPESGYLADSGQWNSIELAMNGEWRDEACRQDFPATCALIRNRFELDPKHLLWPSHVQDKLGTLKPPALMANIYQALPGAHIRAHFGTHGRLVASLGLRVSSGATLRVGSESRHWEEGNWLLFDDSFMHEVVNDAPEPRYVLALAILHPDCCNGCRNQ